MGVARGSGVCCVNSSIFADLYTHLLQGLLVHAQQPGHVLLKVAGGASAGLVVLVQHAMQPISLIVQSGVGHEPKMLVSGLGPRCVILRREIENGAAIDGGKGEGAYAVWPLCRGRPARRNNPSGLPLSRGTCQGSGTGGVGGWGVGA